MAITQLFQSCNTGSTPVTRSISKITKVLGVGLGELIGYQLRGK